jgi:hypothetical protein
VTNETLDVGLAIALTLTLELGVSVLPIIGLSSLETASAISHLTHRA